MDKHVHTLSDLQGISSAPITPQLFAAAGKEHMEKYGINFMQGFSLTTQSCTNTNTFTFT